MEAEAVANNRRGPEQAGKAESLHWPTSALFIKTYKQTSVGQLLNKSMVSVFVMDCSCGNIKISPSHILCDPPLGIHNCHWLLTATQMYKQAQTETSLVLEDY